MRLLHCSKKLLSQLNSGKSALDPDKSEPQGLGHWNAHLVFLDRKKCLLFTHIKTTYSVFLPDLQKKDFQDLPGLFLPEFLKWLKRDGLYNLQSSNKILEEYSDLGIASTNNNKRVIGYMNDRFHAIEYYYFGRSSSFPDWSTLGQINEILTRIGKDYKYPKELMKELLGQF